MNADLTIVDAQSPWWRVRDAAAYARVSQSQIFRACAARQIEHVKIGGRKTIVTRREWVDQWLESQRVHVAPIEVQQAFRCGTRRGQ